MLAQGAIERPLVFEGNDTPGVMLASAARILSASVSVLRWVAQCRAHGMP